MTTTSKRGGARPGAGRPRGSKTKRRKPLQELLDIMNNRRAPIEWRTRAAIAALPFCHQRIGRGPGKKELAQAAAEEVAESAWGGMLAVPPPPGTKKN